MYRVYFSYKDNLGDVNNCYLDFEDKLEAINFLNHITETTQEMILKYGHFGIYKPYYNIRIKEK